MLGGVRPVGHALLRFPASGGGWVRGGWGLALLAVLVGVGRGPCMAWLVVTIADAEEWAVSVVTLPCCLNARGREWVTHAVQPNPELAAAP